MVGINPLGKEIEDDPAIWAGVFVDRHSYRIKLRRALLRVKGNKNSEVRTGTSEFETLVGRLFQLIEILL
jgi:hypothetical protein